MTLQQLIHKHLVPKAMRNVCIGCKEICTCADVSSVNNDARQHIIDHIPEFTEAVKAELIEYFGHILNDGVTGKPMNVSTEEIAKDIITLLTKSDE